MRGHSFYCLETIHATSSNRPKDTPILNRKLIVRVVSAAAIIVLGTLIIFYSELRDGVVTAKDTTMTFTTFVFYDMFNALCCRSERKSIFEIGFTTNRAFLYAVSASVVGQLLVIYVPFFQNIFRTEALTVGELVLVTLIASSIFWLDELRKMRDAGRLPASFATLTWWIGSAARKTPRTYSKMDKDALEMV